MPYPPQPAYEATTPETSLDPQRNGIAGGTGNANTIPGTASAEGGSAMPPYSSSTYDHTLAANLDDGRELVGTNWSATSTMSVIDNDGNGTGRDVNDTLCGLSFPSVNMTSCSQATLTVAVNTETVAGTVKVRGQSQASAASAQWATGNLPSAATMVAAEETFSSAIATKTIDVTTIVQQIMAGAAWASGNRINFTLEAASASVSCGLSNYASGLTRLQITS